MSIRYRDVTIVTDTSGAGTATANVMPGVLQAIVYSKTDFANGGTVTVTSSFSGGTIWRQAGVNASVTVYPTATVVDSAGTATGGYVQPIITEACVVTVSGCGSAKTGAYRLVYSEDA